MRARCWGTDQAHLLLFLEVYFFFYSGRTPTIIFRAPHLTSLISRYGRTSSNMQCEEEDTIRVSKSNLNYLLALVRLIRYKSDRSNRVNFNSIIVVITDILQISSVTNGILTENEVLTARKHLEQQDFEPLRYNRNPLGSKQGISGYQLGETVKSLRELVQESSLAQRITGLNIHNFVSF